MEGKPAAEVSAAVPSEWPEDCEALSLDRVLQRFAQQETALRRVAKDLAVETQRHEKLMAKLEAMVWDRFAGEDSFPKSPASPSESVMLERPREPTLERPQGGSRLWGSQVEQMASAKSKAPHIHDLYTANDLLPQITRAQRDSALVGGHDWIMHIRNYLSSYTSDMMLGIVIAANMIVMFCQVQWAGYVGAETLGLRGDDAGWEGAEGVFESIECVFISIYLLDVVLRTVFLPLSRLKQPLDLADTLVVLVCAVEAFILRPAGLADWDALIIFRFIRACRILRVVRILRFMKLFQNLHVLIQTLGGMLLDLFWGSLLIFIVVMTSGLLMTTLVQPYILDASLDMTTRRFLYAERHCFSLEGIASYYDELTDPKHELTHEDRFGHADSSSYYLFEAAMTTAWVSSSGPLIFEVNKTFAFFWIPFVMVVNFAMTRVVAALFLKQTLEVAAKERERVANDAKTKKDKMAKRLRDVFKLADDTGDGCVELAEFQQMLDEPEVRETLESMELNHHEVRALVELLSGGERPVPILDFLHAALTMHEQAKTIHLMQASMDIAKVEREVLSIGAKQNALLKRLGMAAEIAAL